MAEDAKARARFLGRRVVFVMFGAFVAIFCAVSAVEIVSAVFGIGAPIASTAGKAPISPVCAERVRALESALRRAAAEGALGATPPTDETAAVEAFRRALSPEWDDERAIGERCATDPRGTDAFAAVVRLRLAHEGLVRRRAVEVSPLERDVAAYLSP